MADKTWIKCLTCNGSGVIQDTSIPPKIITCPRCNGQKVEVISVITENFKEAIEAWDL